MQPINITKRPAAATVSLYAASGFFALFLLLHVIEPQFDPTWRFVSEYSNGQYGFVMRLAFLLLAVATAAAGVMFKQVTGSKLATTAAIAFFVSAAGLVLAASFNQDPVTSKEVTMTGNLHGVATLLGIPGFSIGALAGGLWLQKRGLGMTAAIIGSLTLVSFLAMLIYLFTGISKDTGFAPGTYTGLFNRVLILAMVGALVYFAAKVSTTLRLGKNALGVMVK